MSKQKASKRKKTDDERHLEADWAGVDFDGLEVTVVTPETLYRMKKGTVRMRDRGDAERIRQRFGLEED